MSDEPDPTIESEMREAFTAASAVSVSLLAELSSISLATLTESVARDLLAHGLSPDGEGEQIVMRVTVASTYARIVESLALAVTTT